MSLPPDLRVVCRKLAVTALADLPAICPILVDQILSCGKLLSTPVEQQRKSNASNEAAVLVHKLKTQISTLLQGKTVQGRFSGTVLAKAVVDAGGWECLRTTEPWVRALLSLLQKPDSAASQDLAIVTLTRIYVLLQTYPTLVREIATPTLPAFTTSCLQLIRPAASGKPPKVSMYIAETAIRSLSALIRLYPTTLRPFTVQIRTAIRAFVAPTPSDCLAPIPYSLRRSSRDLLVVLHYTAAKNGNADEWAKLVSSLVKDAHATADQVFRAIREAGDPGPIFSAHQVSSEGEPNGGGDGIEDLPIWTGLQCGVERLVGLIETIAQVFCCPTKLPVTVPLGVILQLVTRISLVSAPAPNIPDRDFSSFINASIGREEREELWSLLPKIHIATLELLCSIVKRIGANAVPFAPEILDVSTHIFAANRYVPRARRLSFALLNGILPLIGPSLVRTSVDALVTIIQSCCEDILESANYLRHEKPDEIRSSQNGVNGSHKGRSSIANADLFLKSGSASAGSAQAMNATRLDASHLCAAGSLVTAIMSYIPQQHIKKAYRTLLDRTAIVSANKSAMVSSVLRPYVDQGGRYFANTIPFLARAYPHEVDMEVLRSNLRTAPHYFGNIFATVVPGEYSASDESDDEFIRHTGSLGPTSETTQTHLDDAAKILVAANASCVKNEDKPSLGGFSLPSVFPERTKLSTEAGNADNSFETTAMTTSAFEPLILKRKPNREGDEISVSKRLDTGKAAESETFVQHGIKGQRDDASDDGSESSVQLEMVFDRDDDEESD